MNPSTSGWIQKFCSQIAYSGIPYKTYDALYASLKDYGFIYGVNVKFTKAISSTLKFSEDELAKINLITGLYHIYNYQKDSFSTDEFTKVVLDFYTALEVSDLNIWDKLVIGNSKHSLLEKLVNDRIKVEDNIISRNFNRSIINSLLFVDVLAFEQFLVRNEDPKTYSANLERIIVGTLYQSLNSRTKITAYDKQIIDNIEASALLHKTNSSLNKKEDQIVFNISYNEKKYLLDLLCLSIWDDDIIEKSEYQFLLQLSDDLELDSKELQDAIFSVSKFQQTHQKEVLLFQQNNPIANFYDNSSQLVTKLIRRNSKRLVKELKQSKELMLLITKSTHSDLSKEEQKRLQSQLIDVLKTIPSLAIFMLPGGAILLPLFAKLIPNLLPSAFDDNRIDK